MLILLSVLLSLSSSSFAATKSWKSYFSWTEGEKMPSLIKDARKRKTKRGIASNQADPSLMSEEYKVLRDKIMQVQSPDELAKMLVELEKKVDSYPADAKLLGSIVLLLKPMRGIVYRMIPMVEKPKITHSFLRTQVKTLASNMRIYLPFEHWEAGFAFLTEPYAVNGKAVEQFKNPGLFSKDKRKAIQKYQDYLESDVYPAFAEATKRVEAITLDKPLVWDNKLVFGAKSFPGESTDRYRYIQEGERRLALSSLHGGMHYLSYLISYDVNDILKLSKAVGKMYGIDGWDRGREIEGVPSYRVMKAVSKYPNIFTLRDGKQTYMEQSFLHLRESIRQIRLAREEVRNESPNRLFLLNSERIDPWSENFEKQMAVAECLVGLESDEPGICPVKSAITGEVVKVNLAGFYYNPPKDLKSLMPTEWNIKEKSMNNKSLKVKYPNYFWGMPTNWNKKAYQNYFPEIGKGTDVIKHVRVLRQAYGGEFFGAPFALFVE